MAKNNKGGLGRGLGSLLGNSTEKVTTLNEIEVVNTNKQENSKLERIMVNVDTDEIIDPSLNNNIPKNTQKDEDTTQNDNVSRETVIKKNKEVDLEYIDIAEIEPNPDQPRTNFKEENLKELIESIKKDGVIQPILLRKITDNKYQIIAGERRWQAAKEANIKRIPAQIKSVNDDRALELALIENLQRADLNPIEEAYGYKRLMERKKMTQADIAQAMSKGRSTIANALRLLDLPEEAQQLLFEDKITAGHARAILSIDNREGREKLTNKLKKEKLSVRETESLAKVYSRDKKETNKRIQIPQSFKSVANDLKERLNTDVKVRTSNGKNKIEIVFQDEKELERIFKILSN